MSGDTGAVVTRLELGGAVVLAVSGDLDLGVSQTLTRAIVLWDQAPRAQLVLHLEAVSFIDSTGIACLVKAARACRGGGSVLAVSGAHGQALRMVKRTGIDRLMELHDSLDDALARLGSPRTHRVGSPAGFRLPPYDEPRLSPTSVVTGLGRVPT